jgi:hypothetical protein
LYPFRRLPAIGKTGKKAARFPLDQ